MVVDCRLYRVNFVPLCKIHFEQLITTAANTAKKRGY